MTLKSLLTALILAGIFGLLIWSHWEMQKPPVKQECGIVLKGHEGTYCIRHDISGDVYYETEGKGQLYKIYIVKVNR
jgi:hypothetical protein